MLQSTTGVVSLGQWTSDSKSCEYLLRNTAPEEVYMPGSSVPPFLMSNIEQFISCWKDAERYELEKVTLHNFNILPSEKEVTKQTYPGVWKHFSHTGCVIIFNPNDIDFTVKLFEEPEEYKLVAGGMLFIKTNAKFRYLMDEKSSKLKHMVFYSFGKRV